MTYISGTAITYDDLHRIKTFLPGLPSSGYIYDSIGNITTSIESGSSVTYDYGNNARKQAVKTVSGKKYFYDQCGNMIVRGAQALEYDPENHLVRLSQPGTLEVEFGYAGSGERLWKRKNGTDLQIWIGNLYEEKGGKTLFHIYAGDQRVCTFEPGSKLAGGTDTAKVGYYYHEDHLGSSSALSDWQGVLLEGNTWYPFGRTQTASPQASFQVSRRFTGQVFDAETGLYYYNARYYDPELGRFVQADTIIPDISNPQSYNRYSYVVNNPLRYTDPTGHSGQSEVDEAARRMGIISGRDWKDYNEAAADLGISGFRIPTMGNLAVVSAVAHGTGKATDAYITLVPELVTAGIATPVVKVASSRFGQVPGWFRRLLGKTGARESSSAFRAFESFDALKSVLGPAGEGRVWHHIVEQRGVNVKRFGAEAVHNTENVVNVSREVNQTIANYYSSKRPFTGGKIVREWLETQSYQRQTEFGREVLRRVEQKKPLK